MQCEAREQTQARLVDALGTGALAYFAEDLDHQIFNLLWVVRSQPVEWASQHSTQHTSAWILSDPVLEKGPH